MPATMVEDFKHVAQMICEEYGEGPVLAVHF